MTTRKKSTTDSKKTTSKKVLTKKATSKKVVAKKPAIKKIIGQKEILFKTVGRNVKVVIGEETFSKAIATAEGRAEVKTAVESYNTKNSIVKEKAIRVLMEKVTNTTKGEAQKVEEVKQKTAKAKTAKTVKKTAPKTKISSEALEEAKKLLEANGHIVSKVAEPQQRRRGEY